MDGIPTAGEGSAIYNCVLCDSYSLITLGLLPDKKLARGLKGKKAFEDLLEIFQVQNAKESVMLLACPTCNTFARQSDASSSTGGSGGDHPSSSSAATASASNRGGGGGGGKNKNKKKGGADDADDDEGGGASQIVVGDQLEQGEFLRDGLAVLCPSFLVTFDTGELPPIYADEQNQPGGKPKWRLAQGRVASRQPVHHQKRIPSTPTFFSKPHPFV